MKVAIIPARGGSKRIPRKNIRTFGGLPMIAWSIVAARESGSFDRIIVSTDEQEIADVAVRHGAEIPFLRPAELSDDMTGTAPVIAHAVAWFADQGISLTAACCIYATAPFLQAEDLRRGEKALASDKADFALAVANYPYPIERAAKVGEGGWLEMIHPEYQDRRSQDLRQALHDAGQFCWGTASAWRQQKPVFMSRTVPIILPRHRVQDIDTPEDWDMAELMFKATRAPA